MKIHPLITVLAFLITVTAELSAATYNVITYGASGNYDPTGNPTENDTSYIQSAITAAAADTSGSATVYFPAGQYRVTSALTIPSTIAANITFLGEDEGLTNVVATTAANVFDLSYPNGSYHPIFKYLTIASRYTGGAGGSAIKVTYPSSANPGTGLVANYVQVDGYPPTSGYFGHGIELVYASHSNISGCLISGSVGTVPPVGDGIKISGESDSTTVSDSQMNLVAIGVNMSDTETALSISRCYFVADVVGIYSNSTCSTLLVDGGHIDFRGTTGVYGIHLASGSSCNIKNILFLTPDVSSTVSTNNAVGVQLDVANGCTIEANTFLQIASGSSITGVILGLSGAGSGTSYGNMVDSNLFNYAGGSHTAIIYNSGVSSSHVWSNNVSGPGVTFWTNNGPTSNTSDGYNSLYNTSTSSFSNP